VGDGDASEAFCLLKKKINARTHGCGARKAREGQNRAKQPQVQGRRTIRCIATHEQGYRETAVQSGAKVVFVTH
jgi:hypothetical protein